MPIFEYRCRQCGRSLEKIEKEPPRELLCPQCGGTAERVVSSFSAKSSDASGGCAPRGGFG